jgi:hypothetical protein
MRQVKLKGYCLSLLKAHLWKQVGSTKRQRVRYSKVDGAQGSCYDGAVQPFKSSVLKGTRRATEFCKLISPRTDLNRQPADYKLVKGSQQF